jgi:hypothetical protein
VVVVVARGGGLELEKGECGEGELRERKEAEKKDQVSCLKEVR